MKRAATVIAVNAVSTMTQTLPAWQVDTDLADKQNQSFYLERPGPRPAVGEVVIYGDHNAWFEVDGQEVQAHKLEFNFDPDQPFH